MSLVAIAAVLSTMHYEADVPIAGGDYLDVPFAVPAGSVECQIHHDDGSSYDILDWGVFAPDGSFRGWGGGLTDDAIIGVDQSSRGYLPGPIAAGMWTVSIGKAQLDTNGGHYVIDVTCRDDATLPVLTKASYVAVTLSADRRWYKGDFHVHSEQSGDASATFDQIYALATQRGLDFINMSDHNTVAQHALIAAYQPAHMGLLITRGAEITTYGGHGNALGLTSYVDHRIGRSGRTIAQVLADVQAQGAIFIVNHPTLELGTACIGCAWSHVDDTPWDQVSAMELITGNFDISQRAFTPAAIALWDAQLVAGRRIAAVGGSDDHKAGINEGTNPSEIGSPTTLVLADNLSEAAIIDAIKHGRTILQLRGPDDPLVDFTIAGKEIGDDVDGVGTVDAKLHITGGTGSFYEIWRDGAKLNQVEITSDDFTATFSDKPGAGDFRYRVELIDDTNQRIVITSHIYVHAISDAGCGCRAASPGSGLPLAACAVLLRRRRRRAARTGPSPRAGRASAPART